MRLRTASFLEEVVAELRPEAVVHYAEQRSAPFSMIDRDHAVMTQLNNVAGTLNLLFAIHEHAPDCHLVKLGTMGEYGTPNIDIEEGYITIEHKGQAATPAVSEAPGLALPPLQGARQPQHPLRLPGVGPAGDRPQPGSGVRLRHRGDGAPSRAARHTVRLRRLCGTVLNRFIVQSAIGHPLTVYGSGGQTRGFLDIRDTLQCVELASLNPAEPGEFRVFNQFTEQFTVLQLAEHVKRAGDALGYAVELDRYVNPRVEAEHHYYNAVNDKLLGLGLQPHYLGDEPSGRCSPSSRAIATA